MYSREDETGWRQSAAFKKAFSIDVDIDLIGVWYVNALLFLIFTAMTSSYEHQGYRYSRICWRHP